MNDGAFQQRQSIVVAVAFTSTLKPVQQTVQVKATEMDIEDVVGELIDPNVVDLVVRKGNGTSSRSHYNGLNQAYIIDRDDVGVYYAKIELDVPGLWLYRWEGDPDTNEAKVSDEVSVMVKPVRISVP